MKNMLKFIPILFLPISVFAMTPVPDSELSDITGRSGVNINPDITMNINIGTLAWGDGDGIKGVYNPWPEISDGGYVGFNNFTISNLKIGLRTDPNDHWNNYSTLMQKPITIDVATGTKLGVPDTSFIRIGTGALKISTDLMQFDIALGPRADIKTGNAPVLSQTLGTATLAPMDVYVNPQSYVDIYSHARHGVTFDVNVTLDHISIPCMSWGGHR
jgi:hypothetical protein